MCTPVFLNRVREKEKAGRKKEIQVNEQQHYETVSGTLIIIFIVIYVEIYKCKGHMFIYGRNYAEPCF